MKVDYSYNKRNKFAHKFHFIQISEGQRIEIYQWIKESGGKYNVDYIYWGLKNKPAWADSEVHLTECDIGMAFKLKYL